MNQHHSVLAVRSKQEPSVPPQQIPTASQPQLPEIDENTTATINSSARTPNAIGLPPPRVRPWELSKMAALGATPSTQEDNNASVSQPQSNRPATTMKPLARTPNAIGLLPPRVRPWESSKVAALGATPLIHESSALTVNAIVATHKSMSASPSGSAKSLASDQSLTGSPVPATKVYTEPPNFYRSFCVNTEHYVTGDGKARELPVPLLAEYILKGAGETPLPDLAKTWSRKLRLYNQGTRKFEVVKAVLELIDKQDPNYESRVKQRELSKQIAELFDNFMKHKIASETDIPFTKFAPSGSTQPRKIAPLKKTAANKASYIPTATGSESSATASEGTVRPDASPVFIFGNSNPVAVFGQIGRLGFDNQLSKKKK
ncbi:hypothetical protein NHQ30_009294 [Ciborinia camelliae]|nr:hypothetical protein NHQ30_009294 [Ciborinia camelliae]